MYTRHHLSILKKRLSEPRKFIQVIIGPRQVGKTTLIKQLIQEWQKGYHFASADALNAEGAAWLEQQWETARVKALSDKSSQYILIIDEIQKINNWSEVVKAQWDKDTMNGQNLKVILLGSSRLLLQKGLTESLAGRFETIYMGHWTYIEMKDAFGFEQNKYIWFGGYPGSVDLINNEERWKNYISNSLIESTVSKDILMLSRVDKPALLKRLFNLGCLYSGQVFSYNKMLGQFQDAGNTTTLAHYLNLLDTAGLLAGIEKYSTNKLAKRSSSPKFQVHNTALISALEQNTFDAILHKPSEWGRIVESAIGAYLLNISKENDFNIYYWRESNQEVDFVLERENKIIGLEIKSSRIRNTTGMETFKKKFNPYKIILVGKDGIDIEEFLKLNPLHLF